MQTGDLERKLQNILYTYIKCMLYSTLCVCTCERCVAILIHILAYYKHANVCNLRYFIHKISDITVRTTFEDVLFYHINMLYCIIMSVYVTTHRQSTFTTLT